MMPGKVSEQVAAADAQAEGHRRRDWRYPSFNISFDVNMWSITFLWLLTHKHIELLTSTLSGDA